MRRARGLSLISLLVVAGIGWSAPAAGAAVLIVDGSGGGDFTSIQAAIDAATDGDILLVMPGDYGLSTPVIDDKALTLVAASSGAVAELDSLRVENLAAGKSVVVRGLTLVPDPFFIYVHVEVSDCAGSVWFEDCELEGATGGGFLHQGFPGDPGVAVTNCQAVSFTRCSITGGDGYDGGVFNTSGAGGPGADIEGSSVAFHECQLRGGEGGTGLHKAAGGAGARVKTSEVLFSGSSAVGGVGFTEPSDGVVVTDALSAVAWLDSSFEGGSVGGSIGEGIVAPPGTVSSWPASARSLEVSTPHVPSEPVTVDLAGQGGDQVFFFWTVVGDHRPIPGTQGWLLLDVPLQGPFFLATLPPSGTDSFVVSAPPLFPSTLPGFTFILQGYFANGAEVVAGSGTAFVLMAAS